MKSYDEYTDKQNQLTEYFNSKLNSEDGILLDEAVKIADFYNEIEQKKNILTESMVFNTKDIYYNKDKFDSGEINLCFITGHSGSGKSTMGANATKGKEDKVEAYSLDDLQWSWKFSDDNLKEYGDLIYSFFKGQGKKYRIPYKIEKDGKLCGLNGDDVNKWYKDNGFGSLNKYVDQATNAFVDYAINYASSHKNKKYIIEGIQLFLFIDPSKLKDYAVYIKGTSALISTIRGVKRDSFGPTHIVDNMSMFIARMKDIIGVNGFESHINKYRKYFTNLEEKSVNESTTNTDYITIPINTDKAKKYIRKDPYMRKYEDYLSNNAGEILVDKDSDDVIGYVFVGSSKDKGFISTLEVKKQYRGQGFGNILLEDAIKKYDAIDLEVKKDNKIAINLYKKYGFKVVSDGRNDNYHYMKISES